MGMRKEAFFEDAVLEKNEKNNGNLKWLLFRISNLKKKNPQLLTLISTPQIILPHGET